MKYRCAILDDYQNAALTLADWASLSDQVEVRSFTRHIDNEEELADTLADYDILVIMRERTPFRASLFARLPRLKLLVTTGMRNVDRFGGSRSPRRHRMRHARSQGADCRADLGPYSRSRSPSCAGT